MNPDITVVTPATTTALTTLDRVKLELSINNDDSDEILTVKISEASSDIAVRCDPALLRETVTETYYPDREGACSDKLVLRRYPVASVSSVTVDGVALTEAVIVDDVVTALAEYRLDGASGLLYRQTTSGYSCHWSFCVSIAVTYAGGYLLPGEVGRNLPPSLEAACVELVSSYWAARGRDPSIKAEENIGVYRYEYWVGAIGEAGDLPPGVMSKIAPFRRTVLA